MIELLMHLFDVVAIAGGEARIVGGAVRDGLLTLLEEGELTILDIEQTQGASITCSLSSFLKNQADLDLACDLKPVPLMIILEANGFRCFPTGIEHGTITVALARDVTVEITSLRKDACTYGRHADVEFGATWEEDAMRRDFTINALYMDRHGRVYDYVSGLPDLSQKILRFVGNTERRLQEDYLRILRYFRFYARFPSFQTDAADLDAITEAAPHLTKLSGERINQEMMKLLSYQSCGLAVAKMLEYNIAKYIELYPVRDAVAIADLDCTEDPLVNLAAILHGAHQDDVLSLMQRWRFSKAQKHKLQDLHLLAHRLRLEEADSVHEAHIYRLGKERYLEALTLRNILAPSPAKYAHLVKLANKFVPPYLPITGHDLLKLGWRGEKIGKGLRLADEFFLKQRFKVDKQELLDYITRESQDEQAQRYKQH